MDYRYITHNFRMRLSLWDLVGLLLDTLCRRASRFTYLEKIDASHPLFHRADYNRIIVSGNEPWVFKITK